MKLEGDVRETGHYRESECRDSGGPSGNTIGLFNAQALANE